MVFAITKEIEGSYTVNLDGNVGQFAIFVPAPMASEPVDTVPVKPAVNLGLIFGTITGCVAVAAALLIYFLVWRKSWRNGVAIINKGSNGRSWKQVN